MKLYSTHSFNNTSSNTSSNTNNTSITIITIIITIIIVMMLPQALLKPLLTVTAATLGSLTFTALIDCQPSLFVWDRWHRILHRSDGNNRNDDADGPPRVIRDFYEGKNVWIIGASSGIGEEMALQLSRAGCANLILSARHETRLQRVAQQCRKAAAAAAAEAEATASATATSPTTNERSFQCYCQPLDIVSTEGSEELEARFEHVLRNQLPPSAVPIDIVVFNAGAGQLQPSLETPARTIQRIMDVNALWPMILTPLLFKHNIFRSQRHHHHHHHHHRAIPHIVVTNSIAAQLPVPLSAVYAASKAAQARYFASLVAEQPPGSIRVDVLCPGPIDTDFHRNHADDATTTVSDESGTAATKDRDATSPRTKMAVDRCVRLMVSAAARRGSNGKGGYREVWIAPPPLVPVLFFQRHFPDPFQRLATRFGQRRVQLWREGKDLYDPKSW